MARSRANRADEVIDLSSDSEDEISSDDTLYFFNERPEQSVVDEQPDNISRMPGRPSNHNDAHAFAGDIDRIIDLTATPDVDVPLRNATLNGNEAVERRDHNRDTNLLTEDACVEMVLAILPDISISYVQELISKKTTTATPNAILCERIIAELLDEETSPREADDDQNKKRKRGSEDGWSDYENEERGDMTPKYERDVVDLLKDEFLNIPVRLITNVCKEQKTIFKAYIVLEEHQRNHGPSTKAHEILLKARLRRGVELSLIAHGSQIPKELHAAKKKVACEMAKRRKVGEAEEAELANLEQAKKKNEIGECACCFDDVPLNRMISCSGDTTHFYCKECPRRQIETQIGQSKCRPHCFGVDDCTGTFTRSQLQQVLSEMTFERLEHMQQQEDLAAAGLDFLSECPFCDFKMECLPVEIDKEFRCQNKKCSKTSCRVCQKETHIPLSCEEARKDGQITLRHVVEEAMSEALIRHCNQCKHPFVKEHGCNKMTCSHCRNLQCYVCSKNVKDYSHFGDDKCPLHENVEARHEQEVKEAANEAMAKVRAENPDLSDADLMIKVSDRVKKVEDERRTQAGIRNPGLVNRIIDGRRIPLAPPAPGAPVNQPVRWPQPPQPPGRARPAQPLQPIQPLPPAPGLVELLAHQNHLRGYGIAPVNPFVAGGIQNLPAGPNYPQPPQPPAIPHNTRIIQAQNVAADFMRGFGPPMHTWPDLQRERRQLEAQLDILRARGRLAEDLARQNGPAMPPGAAPRQPRQGEGLQMPRARHRQPENAAIPQIRQRAIVPAPPVPPQPDQNQGNPYRRYARELADRQFIVPDGGADGLRRSQQAAERVENLRAGRDIFNDQILRAQLDARRAQLENLNRRRAELNGDGGPP